MRRSDHPSRPSARICCCLSLSKTLLMPVTELAFRPDVNVSIATGNGRFSAVDQWPVLGVHQGVNPAGLRVSYRGHARGHKPQINELWAKFSRSVISAGWERATTAYMWRQFARFG